MDRFLIAGEQADVLIGLSEACRNPGYQKLHVADAVTAEVRNPEGEPVPSMVTGPVRNETNSRLPTFAGFETVATVSFTPDRPGRWRISAVFEPSIGSPSLSVEVVEAHVDAGFRVVAMGAMPADCIHYAVTDLGAVVCTPELRSTTRALFTSRGTQYDGSSFSVDRNAVWRLLLSTVSSRQPGTIERYVDDGAALQRTHQLTEIIGNGTDSGGAGVIAASQGDVWLAPDSTGGLLRAHPEPDGGFTLARMPLSKLMPNGISVGVDGVHVWGTSTAAESSGAMAIVSALFDGGTRRVQLGSEQIAGFEGDTFYTWRQQEFGVGRLTAGSVPRAFVFVPKPFNEPPRPSQLSPVIPVVPMSEAIFGGLLLKPAAVIPRFDGAQIWLENYDAGTDYWPVSSADSQHAFARSRDGLTVKVFDR
jgi:hypothetical protein